MYSKTELDAIDKYEKFVLKNGEHNYKSYLKQIPEETKKFKCYNCFASFRSSERVAGNCPECGTKASIQPQCPIEHISGCIHETSSGFSICPICGEFVCPQCLTMHSVIVISRVTGYVSVVGGWSAGKRQELLDRVHSNLNAEGDWVKISPG
jgi:hypothetical protein